MSNYNKVRSIFDDAYSIIFEANQDHMSASGKEKDIKKRNNAQTIGMEIEFYSPLDCEEVDRYIEEDLAITRGDGERTWNAEEDASLSAGESVAGNSYNDRFDGGDELNSTVASDMYGEDHLISNINYYLHDQGTYEEIEEVNELLADEMSEASEDPSYTPKSLLVILDECNWENPAIIKAMIDGGATSETDLENLPDLQDELFRICEGDRRYEAFILEEYYDQDGTFDDEPSEAVGMYGVEINFSGPRKLGELDTILTEIDEIMSDSGICATHVEGKGESGLHVHFGLASHELTHMDMMRLVVNSDKSGGKIVRLGGRAPGEWQQSVTSFIDELDEFIDPKSNMSTVHLPNEKYFGTSFYHHDGKGTVEFRWAHSKIASESEQLREYIELLIELINTSFTGSNEFAYSGVTIKEIATGTTDSTQQLVVIKDGKMVKRGVIANYVDNIRSSKDKLNNKIHKMLLYIKGHKELIAKGTDELTSLIDAYPVDVALDSPEAITSHYNAVTMSTKFPEEYVDDINTIYKLSKSLEYKKELTETAIHSLKMLESRYIEKTSKKS